MPAREITAPDSPILALAVAGAQTAAMFAVSGAIITAVCLGLDTGASLRRGRSRSPIALRWDSPKS